MDSYIELHVNNRGNVQDYWLDAGVYWFDDKSVKIKDGLQKSW